MRLASVGPPLPSSARTAGVSQPARCPHAHGPVTSVKRCTCTSLPHPAGLLKRAPVARLSANKHCWTRRPAALHVQPENKCTGQLLPTIGSTQLWASSIMLLSQVARQPAKHQAPRACHSAARPSRSRVVLSTAASRRASSAPAAASVAARRSSSSCPPSSPFTCTQTPVGAAGPQASCAVAALWASVPRAGRSTARTRCYTGSALSANPAGGRTRHESACASVAASWLVRWR